MDGRDIADLRKIGLTDGEMRIYAALLELGECTRTTLAKASGVSPSKIYDVSNRLLEKGIISAVKKNGVLHFSAADPRRLEAFLEQKEQEIARERAVVGQLLPMLNARYAKSKERLDVEVFYDWEGMQTVYDDLVLNLGPGEESCVFGASPGENSARADQFFQQYYRKVERKGYRLRVIFNEGMRADKDRIGYFSKHKRHEARFLLQDTFAEINTYKDTVLFIMLLKRPTIIRVRNKEAAVACKKFFESLWKQARP